MILTDSVMTLEAYRSYRVWTRVSASHSFARHPRSAFTSTHKIGETISYRRGTLIKCILESLVISLLVEHCDGGVETTATCAYQITECLGVAKITNVYEYGIVDPDAIAGGGGSW